MIKKNTSISALCLVVGLFFQVQKAHSQIEKCESYQYNWVFKDTLGALKLVSCNLSELPKDLVQFVMLKHLDASQNEIRYATFEYLPNLIGLDLSHNKLVSVHKSIDQMKTLQFLYLDHNELTKIPETIKAINQLKVLDLSNNLLVELPEHLGELTQLDSLDLQENKLVAINNWINPSMKLKYI
ncbi:MAG: leucine-rich repeat domain-containing protein, partial [Crocinitomix sp.]|nr:leucine-rich repeat domain-containing protein [Crocinitomix sp.]